MLRVRGAARLAVVTALVAGSAMIAVAGPAGAATTLSRYQAVPSSRLLDTRDGIGAPRAQVAAGGHVALAVTGRGGVPSSGVSAVVLNVTVTNPAGPGYAIVYADGQTAPTASNLNYVRGQTVANLVIAPVGGDGKVDIGVSQRSDLLADVSGYYYSGGAATAAGTFGSLTPDRVLDTRNGTGAPKAPVPSRGKVAFTVEGQGGVPPTGVTAVVLNVTVTNPVAAGYATAYADGKAPPTASNLNYVARQTVANLVVAPIGADGQVAIGVYAQADVIADIDGYYVAGTPAAAGTFGSLPGPARVLDTRTGIGAAKARVAAGAHVAVQVDGSGGVPSTGVAAVVLNVTVTGPAGAGFATVYPDGTPQPDASNINFVAGQTVPNLVIAAVGPDGKVDIAVSATTDLVADVSGYIVIGAPQTSTSRYVRDITGAPSDAATMNAQGCTDATSNGSTGSHVMVLDIGAQSIHSPPLSLASPGVALSGTNPVVRLTDAQLVTAIEGYIDGYASATCHSGQEQGTIVVSTNSDGDWSGYLATPRGQDWANHVILPLAGYAAGKSGVGLTVDAGIDAEAGFAATEADVETWMSSYLGVAGSGTLVDLGSADGCPVTLGTVHATCQPIGNDNNGTNTWTQAQYYRMAHGLSPSRIVALPQIYSTQMAIQWADIDRTGASATDQIDFIGTLTEHAACAPAGSGCTSIDRPTAFDAFSAYLSTGTNTATAGLTYATDLQVDPQAG